MNDFSGIWTCTHWYPSNTRPGSEESCQHTVKAEQTGKQLILQSIPDPEKSYLLLRLIVDGISAAGTWTENTTPGGEYDEMIYSGQLQLIISDDQKAMRGAWVGIGRDHENDRPDIYTGRWELIRPAL